MPVTLNGRSYTASDFFGSDGYGYAKRGVTGAPLFPDQIFSDLLAEIGLIMENNFVQLEPKKNLIDKNTLVRGSRYSPGSGTIVTGSNWVRTDRIKVTPGGTYIISGIDNDADMGVGFFATVNSTNSVGFTYNGRVAFTVPMNCNYVVANITDNGGSTHTFDDTCQLELGSVVTTYEAFMLAIPESKLQGIAARVKYTELFETASYNRINPTVADFTRRYSTGGKNFPTDAIGIASVRIAVKEGGTYTLAHLKGMYQDGVGSGPQGGYLTSANATTAVDNIQFRAAASGLGSTFTVPKGLGITHVAINLWKKDHLSGETTLDGPVQLELGDVVTPHRTYAATSQVRADLLNEIYSRTSPLLDPMTWGRFLDGMSGVHLGTKIPNWHKHALRRDKDQTIIMLGCSLNARTIEHCSPHPNAAYRPPLMHGMNVATHIWDRIARDGQHYRRYDAAGYFTEVVGTFATAHNLAQWDDAAYRNGLTRYSNTTGAKISCVVPVKAILYNIIYRTDSLGVQVVRVTIDEGDGQMEVFDRASGLWVEANGYEFSMREATPVTAPYNIPNPAYEMGTTEQYIATRSNTTYQKRLKFRCKSGAIDSRSTTKTMKLEGQEAGRFMYWGAEWSLRKTMGTFINAARGSHNTQATSSLGMPRFQDNEVWEFEPDLLIIEPPIFNDGISSWTGQSEGYWRRLLNNYVFRSDYALSLKSRAAHFGLDPEMILFSSSLSAYNGTTGDCTADGVLKYNEQLDGTMMSGLDKHNQYVQWSRENYPDVPMIHVAKYWYDIACLFDNLQIAFMGTGPGGPTLTADGTHWNDLACLFVAKLLLGIFNYIY